MTRRYINQLGERENIDQIFLAADKQLRANRNGNLYLQLRLMDRTGSLTGMLWNASDRIAESFETGDYLKVQGTTQFHKGALQMIVSRIDRVDPATVDPAEYDTLDRGRVDRLAQKLAAMLREVENVPLRDLAECFLMDEEFMAKFTRAPAGIKNHHAYAGGLLEHVVQLMEVGRAVAALYPQVDSDLLTLGVFLHDAGKIDELLYDRKMGYSDEGQLVGHIIMGVSILEAKAAEAEKLTGETFPPELLLRLKHMIASHHGDFPGSPKLPMTFEAIALHYLDNLDAKISSAAQIIEEDANTDSPWTTFNPGLNRKLYKGGLGNEEMREEHPE